MPEPLNETGISIRSGGTGKGLQLRINVPWSGSQNQMKFKRVVEMISQSVSPL
jgi:hypothetical protein